LIYDTATQEINQGHVPAGFEQIDDKIYKCAEPTRLIAGTAILVKTTYDKNYGHWLFQDAAILALMSKSLNWHRTPIVMSVDGGSRLAEVRSALVSDLCGECSLIGHRDAETVEIEQLLYVSPLHGPPLRKQPETLHFLREYYLRKTYPGSISMARFAAPRRRLYLARRSYLNRQITNHEEIEDVLMQLGFEPYFAEDHSHLAQVQAFAEAEIVVGVKGAALSNTLFSSSKCRVIVLSPPRWLDPFFWDIAGQLGLEYTEIFGSADASGFAVNPSVLRARVLG
jgi:capsular polysaccharide biosynthesis protein